MYMIKYSFIVLIGTLLFMSCEKNEEPYLNIKDSSAYFDDDANRFMPVVSEGNQTLKIPVILAGVPGTYPITLTIAADTTAGANPAIEGVDFIIKKKEITFEEGYGTKYVEIKTIDNDEKNPAKYFDLVIASASRPLKSNPAERITVTIQDDEHPLRQLLGTYKASALDLFSGALEEFNMVMSANPDDDNMVILRGFPVAPNLEVNFRIDLKNNTCWFPAGQTMKIDDTRGTTMLCKCHKKEDGYLGWDFDNIPGIIENNATKFIITEWMGAVLLDESDAEYGGAFFAYKDFTLVKR